MLQCTHFLLVESMTGNYRTTFVFDSNYSV